MKLTIASTLAMFTLFAPAAAEPFSFSVLPSLGYPMPRTVSLFDANTKAPLGTATYSGGRIYLRDMKGEHYATIVMGPGGQTAYDPHGKVIPMPAAQLPQ